MKCTTRARRTTYAVAACLLGCFAPPAPAQTVPAGFVVENAFPGATFSSPMQVVFLPDGRKLVAEIAGRVWVMTAAGVKLPTPLIDLNLEVMSGPGRGLLSVAIDPDFTTNRWVYLLYTVDPNTDGNDSEDECFGRLTRYQVDAVDPNVIDISTREVLIGATWPGGFPTLDSFHVIGTLRFAADKTLLVGAGDGAHFSQVDSGGIDPGGFGAGKTDPSEDIGAFRCLSLNSLAGKILRIDKDSGDGLASNPYWDGDPSSVRSRVWLYGVRNPFRYSIRPGTGSTNPGDGDVGALYVGDVGWNTTEEMTIVTTGGLNLGWPCVEGPFLQAGYQAVVSTTAGNTNVLCSAPLNPENPVVPTSPDLWWDHGNANNSNPVGWTGSSATGGVFYTGASYPAPYQGSYFVADYTANWIRAVEVDASNNITGTTDFMTGAAGPVDIEADPISGDLYYIALSANEVRRIRFPAGPTVSVEVVRLRADDATGSGPPTVPGTGSPWIDVLSGHDATLNNFAGNASSGWQGDGTVSSPYRLQFDGTDDYASISGGTIPELQGTTSNSVAMWLRTGADVTTSQYVIEWVHETPVGAPWSGMTVRVEGGTLDMWRGNADGGFGTFYSGVQPNTWYHVVVTKQPGLASTYVNGVAEGTFTTPHIGDQNSDLIIGGGIFGGNPPESVPFAGAIGQLSIYTGALEASAVAAAFEADEHLYEPSAALPSGLVQLRADRADGLSPYPVPGASSPWVDVIGAHDATLTNFAGAAGSGWEGDGSPATPYVLTFDGVDDRVTIPAATVPALQSTVATSLELWFRTGADVSANQYLAEWLDTFASPYAGMTIGIAGGNLQVYLNPWATISAVQTNTWYHVVVTKRAGQVRVYVDGDLAYEATNDNLGDQNSEIVIGASTFAGAGSYGNFFEGSIARAAVYGGTLRADDVRSLYLEVQPDGILGGKLFDRFWAVETEYVAPQDPGVSQADITAFPEFYRCKSCHGWDRQGRAGAYIGRGPTTTRPNVANVDLTTSLSALTDQQVFDLIKNVGGRDVDPALTGDGTNGLGDPMPDYGKILSDGEIWSLVEFLRNDAVDTDQLYTLSTSGSYPTGTADFLNIGSDGDAVAGNTYFQFNCSNCHGATGLLFPGLPFPDKSVGSILRSEPYEVQHLVKFGNLGTSMLSYPTITTGELKDLYKALDNPAQFPDASGGLVVELRADMADGASPYASGSTSTWVDLSVGAHDAALTGFDGSPTGSWQGTGTLGDPYRLEFTAIDYAQILAGSVPELQGASAYSAELWFRTGATVSGNQYLIEWFEQWPGVGQPYAGMTIGFDNGALRVYGGGVGWIPANFNLDPNTWYHIVVSKQAGLMEVFVNGALTLTSATPNMGSQASHIIIGAGLFSGTPGDAPFTGAIAQVSIYDRPVDAATALAEFNADSALYFAPPVAKALELRADTADGTSAYSSGTTTAPWVDLSGGGHDATLNNFDGTVSSSWQGDGSIADPYRLAFGGGDDYVSIPGGSIPQLQNASSFSAAMWIRTGADVTTPQYIIEWVHQNPAATPWAGMTIQVANNNFEFWRGPSDGGFGAFYTGVLPDTWYHIVVTKDGSAATGYVNGVLGGGAANPSPTPNIGDQNTDLIIGGGIFGNSPPESVPYLGAIAQVCVFDGVLDAAAVAAEFGADSALYFDKSVALRADLANGTGPPTVPGAASPWVDVAGNHDATLVNFTGDASSGWQGSGIPTDPYRLLFDGSDDYVSISGGSIPGLQGNSNYSTAMWVRTGSDVTSSQYLMEWTEQNPSGNPWSGMTIQLSGGNFNIYQGPGDGFGTFYSGVQPNTWYHLVVAKEPGLASTFVNGVAEGTTAIPHLGAQNSDLIIGGGIFSNSPPNGVPYAGAIAQVCIFPTTLDAAAALAEYDADKELYIPSPLSKVVQLRADVADGAAPYLPSSTTSPWTDLAGGHDGVLTNFAGGANSSWQGNGSVLDPHRLEFDGSNDFVLIPAGDVPELQGATEYSASVWFRTGADVGPNQYLIEWFEQWPAQGQPFSGMTLGYSAGDLRIWGGPASWLNLGFTVAPDTWYHVVVSKQPGLVSTYVNGAATATYATPNIGDQVSPLVIGAGAFSGSPGDAPFNGAIAQVCVFNRAMTAGEAFADFAADRALYLQANKVLQLRADMADGAGPYASGTTSPWIDLSAGAHDVTLFNFTGASGSSWQGTGLAVIDPYRLEFEAASSNYGLIPGGTIPELQGTAAYAMSMWIRTGSNVSTSQYLVEWTEQNPSGNPWSGMTIQLSGGNFSIYQGPAIGFGTFFTGVQADTWYHLTVSKQSGLAEAYVDGALAMSFGTPHMGDQNSDMILGGGIYGNAPPQTVPFDGALAQVCIFDASVSAAEVQAEYEADRLLYQNVPTKVVELRGDTADGAGPYPELSTCSPWTDLAGTTQSGVLENFSGSPTSGWLGDGSAGTPARLEFDGIDDRLIIAANSVSELESVAATTVAMWFKTSSDITSNQYLMEWLETFASPYAGMTFAVEAGFFRVWLNPWTDVVPVQTDTWYHVVLAKDGGTLRVYVNGQLELTSGSSNLGDQISEIVIGASSFRGHQSYGEYFEGTIAQVCVFEGALNDGEALAEFEADADLYIGSGACCDQSTGTCTDGVDVTNCAGPLESYTADTLCANLSPACATAPTGACCDGIDGTCASGVFEADCSDLLDTWTDGAACGGPPCSAASPTLLVELRAEAADCSGGPYTVPGAGSPWIDQINGHNAELVSFAGDALSGWQGSGSSADPYRLRFNGGQVARIPGGSVAELQGNTTYSCAVWFHTGTSVAGNQYLIEWFETFGQPYAGMTIGYDGGTLRIYGGTAGWLNLGFTVVPNTWYHLVVSKQPGLVETYVNGVATNSYATPNIASQVSEIVIGAGTFPGVQSYSAYLNTGSIGQVSIWHGALDAAEALAAFEADEATYFPSGACCDVSTGSCSDGVLADDCAGSLEDFTQDTLCANLAPACTIAPTGACCRGAFGTCEEAAFEIECSGPLDTWSEGLACGAVACTIEPPTKILQLRADAGNGVTAYPVPSADSPWVDLASTHDGDLVGFSGSATSGWAGDGTPADPYRLAFEATDHVFIPTNLPELQNNPTYSNEMWFRTGDSVSGNQYLIEWFEQWPAVGQPYSGMTLGYNNGALRVYGGPVGWIGANFTVVPNTWYHVVVSKQPGLMEVFVNGALTLSTGDTNIGSQVSPIVLGEGLFGGLPPGGAPYSGSIGQFCIWHGALDAAAALAAFQVDASLYLPTGACCDELTGSCADDVIASNCQAAGEVWTVGVLCGALNPPCTVQSLGACCDGTDGSCVDAVLEADCMAPLDSWTEGVLCTNLIPACARATPDKIVELRADMANGAGPYPTPGASSPWVDLSAGGHDAFLSNFLGSPTSGWLGDGSVIEPHRLLFDGASLNYATIPGGTIPGLQNNSNYSVAMWYRGIDVTTSQYLVEWVNELPAASPWSGMTVRVANGEFSLYQGPTNGFATFFSGVQAGEWYHIVVTKQPGLAETYVNGVAQGTSSFPNIGDQNTDLIIGGGIFNNNPPESQPLRGALAQMCIFNGTLNAAEALAEFQADEDVYFASGACCDESTGGCTDAVDVQNCQGIGLVFTADTLCSNLIPTCIQAPVGACCDADDGACTDDALEAECQGALETWTEGVLCGALNPPCERELPFKVVDMRADRADNGVGPYAASTTLSPWADIENAHDGDLNNFDGTALSSWQGNGSLASPYRLEFDGTNDYVAIPAGAVVELIGIQRYSLAMWVRTGVDVTTSQYLIEYTDQQPSGAPWSGMTVRVEGGNFDMWRGPDNGGFGTFFSGVQPNTWYHIIVAKKPELATTYVNAVPATSFSGAAANLGSPNSPIIIGGGIFGNAPPQTVPYDGAIAQVCLFDGVLNATDALAEFDADAALYMPQPCGVPADCNDFNDCTVDNCVASFCEFDPVPLEGMGCTDGEICTVSETCQSGLCIGVLDTDSDVDGVCDAEDNCPGDFNPFQEDDDLDGAGDACDNCVGVFNPDQLDSDGQNGGDLCDPCPLDATDTCDQNQSGGGNVDSSGGVVSNQDGSAEIDVPAGALDDDTSISITSLPSNGSQVLNFVLGPDGQTFNTPVTLTFTWADANSDGLVDGTNPAVDEGDLELWQNGVPIAGPCSSDVACDLLANNIQVSVTSFSQFLLAGSGCGNGIVEEPTDTQSCDDLDACTTDSCDEGSFTCVNLAVDPAADCNDSVACTVDSCDMITGCENTASDVLCDDGNACTVDNCDEVSGCSNVDATPANQCCNPANGNLTPIDDGEPCTTDVCNVDGSVDHASLADITFLIELDSLEPGVGATVDRDVEFVLTDCTTFDTDVRTLTVTFDENGLGAAVLTAVNPTADWIAATEGHTLTRALPLMFSSCSASADFSGGDALVSGDFQTATVIQDNVIDIVDFSVLSVSWLSPVADCDLNPAIADPECSLGADATGDGIQSLPDFSALLINFFTLGDPHDACSLGIRGGGELDEAEKVNAISVSLQDLPRELFGADLNRDGVVDVKDMREFARRRQIELSPKARTKLDEIERLSKPENVKSYDKRR